MPGWGANSIQAVWFLQGWSSKKSVDQIYGVLVGKGPASSQTTAAGGATATGTDGQQIYRVQMQPGRVDFFLNPSPGPVGQIPTFADLNVTLTDLRNRLPKGSNEIGDASRLAIVTNTVEAAASAHAAASIIISKLQLALPFNDGEDVIVQVNRKKPLVAIPNVEMNRVMKWLSANFQQINVGPGGVTKTGSDIAMLSVDVNLVPRDNTVYSPADQTKLFEELLDESGRLCAANVLNVLV